MSFYHVICCLALVCLITEPIEMVPLIKKSFYLSDTCHLFIFCHCLYKECSCICCCCFFFCVFLQCRLTCFIPIGFLWHSKWVHILNVLIHMAVILWVWAWPNFQIILILVCFLQRPHYHSWTTQLSLLEIQKPSCSNAFRPFSFPFTSLPISGQWLQLYHIFAFVVSVCLFPPLLSLYHFYFHENKPLILAFLITSMETSLLLHIT